MKPNARVIERFHRTLVEEIRRNGPDQLDRPFTVAEIYQSLVPYRTHRDRIGVEMNGDYEDALLRLLAGEGEFLLLDSDSARDRIRRELQGANPNTGLYREFAALEVRLNPEKLPSEPDRSQPSLDGLAPEKPGEATEAPGAPQAAPPEKPKKSTPVDNGSGTCPDCGKALPGKENVRFCPFCGANPFQVECSACGEELDRSWRFCISCGTPSEG